MKRDMLFTCYCDDGIFTGLNTNDIDREIACLQNEVIDPTTGQRHEHGQALDIEVENDLAGYLGVEISKTDDGALSMTQYHLTKRIIAGLGLEDANTCPTPSTGPLGRAQGSAPRVEEWSYRSIIGMMQYLANNTRSDIAFAVNQVSRFANDPRLVHEKAVKRIGRYLKESLYLDENGIERTQGTIFKRPDIDEPLQLDLWCDADFAGLFNTEDLEDPSSARSRAGYLATLGGLPIVWSSKLIKEICTSTAEAEYSALSSGMKALIPLRRLFFEITEHMGVPTCRVSRISHVMEDNNAARIVATADPPRFTPRNKHWNVKLHWLKQHLSPLTVTILPCASKDQLADAYTKSLPHADFVRMRKLILGW
jgi:hypothetical protein